MKKQYLAAIMALALVTPTTLQAAVIEDADESYESMFGKGPQEEDMMRADQLLITATGSLKPLRLAPSVATVVTKEDIKAIGATSLDEILETVPGLHVVPSGSHWFNSIWSIRGVQTSVNSQVLLLINGVPYSYNYTGNRGAGYRMPVSMISRVEVIRGPGSALHGADAYSGVINVITKDNFEIDGTEIGGRAGSFDRYDGWMQHGGQYGGWDVSMGLEWQKSGGDDDRVVDEDFLHAIGAAALSNAPGPLDTQYETIDGNLGLRKGDWNLHLYGTLKQNFAYGPGGSQAITYGNDGDTKSLLADLAYQNNTLLSDWTLSCRLYYSYIEQDSFIQFYPTDFLNMLGNPIHTSQDGGAELVAIYDGFSGHKLRLGAGWKNFEYEPDQYKNFGPAAIDDPFGQMVHVTDPDHIFTSAANRHLFYGLIQDEWQLIRNWELTAGVRYDEYSDFGSTTNPRAALVWETRHDLVTKLLYGQAFRAPSFAEQYTKNNPVGIGNDDLDAEEIETIELAFDYQPTVNLRLRLNLFHYEANDLIDLTGAALPEVMDNYAEQEGDGVEIEVDWQLHEQLRLRSNFAYQRSENKTVDNVVQDAPEMQFYVNPHWEFMTDWSLDGQYYWISDRHREDGDPRDDIDDYNLVNLTLRRKNIANHFEWAIAVRNLFNEDAREPSPYASAAPAGAYIPNDYPMESRAIWTEVKIHF